MKNKKSNDETTDNLEEIGKGTSKNTIETPKDFPYTYNYGTGKINDYKRSDMLRKMPKPKGALDVARAVQIYSEKCKTVSNQSR